MGRSYSNLDIQLKRFFASINKKVASGMILFAITLKSRLPSSRKLHSAFASNSIVCTNDFCELEKEISVRQVKLMPVQEGCLFSTRKLFYIKIVEARFNVWKITDMK